MIEFGSNADVKVNWIWYPFDNNSIFEIAIKLLFVQSFSQSDPALLLVQLHLLNPTHEP